VDYAPLPKTLKMADGIYLKSGWNSVDELAVFLSKPDDLTTTENSSK
jgi:hypothetical protein